MIDDDDDDREPACDITGLCEPHEDEEHDHIAMCIHCGGTRYKDYPRFGNWGVWDDDLEKSWVHRANFLDTHSEM